MKIRITQLPAQGLRFAESWYKDYVGRDFDVLNVTVWLGGGHRVLEKDKIIYRVQAPFGSADVPGEHCEVIDWTDWTFGP